MSSAVHDGNPASPGPLRRGRMELDPNIVGGARREPGEPWPPPKRTHGARPEYRRRYHGGATAATRADLFSPTIPFPQIGAPAFALWELVFRNRSGRYLTQVARTHSPGETGTPDTSREPRVQPPMAPSSSDPRRPTRSERALPAGPARLPRSRTARQLAERSPRDTRTLDARREPGAQPRMAPSSSDPRRPTRTERALPARPARRPRSETLGQKEPQKAPCTRACSKMRGI